MKNMLYLFLSIFFFFLLQSRCDAQIEEGSYMVGGDIYYRIKIGDGFPFENQVTRIKGAYFLKDRLALGLTTDLKYRRSKSHKITEFNTGVFSRFYFAKKREVMPFFEGAIGLGRSISSFFPRNEKYRFTSFQLSGAVGASYFIGEQWCIDFTARNSFRRFFGESSNLDKIEFGIGAKYFW